MSGPENNSIGIRRPRNASMSSALCRFKTFLKYPHKKPFPTAFVSAGFYYTEEKDDVACFECGLTVGQWKPDDYPLNVHKRLFPECKFINQTKHEFATEIKAEPPSVQEISNAILQGATGFTAKVSVESTETKSAHEEKKPPRHGLLGGNMESVFVGKLYF